MLNIALVIWPCIPILPKQDLSHTRRLRFSPISLSIVNVASLLHTPLGRLSPSNSLSLHAAYYVILSDLTLSPKSFSFTDNSGQVARCEYHVLVP